MYKDAHSGIVCNSARLGATQVSNRGGWPSELWTATQWQAGRLLKDGDVDVYSLKWRDAHSTLPSKEAGYRGTRAEHDAVYFDFQSMSTRTRIKMVTKG